MKDKSFFRRISYEGILADFAVLINLLLYQFLITDISKYALHILWMIGVFQLFALYGLFLGGVGQIFSSIDEYAILKPFKHIAGLFLFLSIGGFFWLGIPAEAINTSSSWTAFSVNLFVVIFGGWIALAMTMDKTELNRFDIAVKYLGPSLYLTFSESLLLYSTRFVAIPVIMLSVMISYFPIRFLMIIKPPVSLLEIITGFTVFILFLMKLTGLA